MFESGRGVVVGAGAPAGPSTGVRRQPGTSPGAVAPARVTGLGRVRAVQALEAARSSAWAELLREVAELVDDMGATGGPAAPLVDGVHRPRAAGGTGDVDLAVEAAAAEVALALVVPLGRAHAVVHEALALTGHLPVTMAALAAGRIDPARARVVVDETLALPDALASAVDVELDGDLGPLTAPQLRARVRHLVGTTDPEAVRRRTRRATCERGVRLFPALDGTAQLVATGPALDLATVFDRLTSAARGRQGPSGRTDPHAATAAGLDPLDLADGGAGLPDRRGMDARRFDALVDLATTAALPDTGATTRPGASDETGAHTGSRPGSTGGRAGSPHGPQVVVALTSLLGLDDEPAQLAPLGPVPVEEVRELLAAGHRFRRALTHPVSGQLIGLDGHLVALDPAGEPTEIVDPPLRLDAAPPGLDAPADLDGSRRRPPRTEQRGGSPATDDAPPVAPPPRRALRRPSRRHCPVLAAGGGAYSPTSACERFVRTRSPRCQAPGCRAPAARCDLDHRRAHGAGGPTCPCNLDVLCRRHHLAKHHHGWHATPLTDDPRDAGLRWTSPLGQATDVPAAPLLPRPGGPARGSQRDGLLVARYPLRDDAAHDAARLHAQRTRQATHDGAAEASPEDAAQGRADDPPPF